MKNIKDGGSIVSVQGSNDEPIDNEEASFEFNKEMFIEEVRKYRCLWDINSESYKNRPIKQNAWGKIAAVFNKDGKCLASLAHFPSPICQNKSFHL